MGMQQGYLSKFFIGFMALLCLAATGLSFYHYGRLQDRLDRLKGYNVSLQKSERIAMRDKTFRSLVARSDFYGANSGELAEPVEFIDKSSQEWGIRLDGINPKPAGRSRGNLKEVAVEITKDAADISHFSQLLFYLEEAYPGGLKVREMILRRKGDGDQWDARVVVSHFTEKGE
ncbi:MAG: hypothetical protein O7H41_02425 [Planctomycetota bacterium]|nr:hypothetical protein [Planctomycetota bacterium]